RLDLRGNFERQAAVREVFLRELARNARIEARIHAVVEELGLFRCVVPYRFERSAGLVRDVRRAISRTGRGRRRLRGQGKRRNRTFHHWRALRLSWCGWWPLRGCWSAGLCRCVVV